MAFDQSAVERVKALNIEEVVRAYNVPLKRRGASLWACCPFPGHEEKTPSFAVTPAKGICKCFGCGRGGDVISFVREMESVDYAEAIRILAKRYNIELNEHRMTEADKEAKEKRDSLFAINEFANNWFQQQMWETPQGQTIAWNYFNRREIREDIARKFNLGYCPGDAVKPYDKHALYDALHEAGYKDEFIEELGICKKDKRDNHWDFFSGRVIFPIHSSAGRIVAFGARILEKIDNVGKYFNSNESEDFYVKSRELYGLYQAQKTIRTKDHCYLCEGYMDVIAMHQNGLEDAIASCGTSLTEQQAKRISRDTHNITILYDGDKAGIKAATRAIALLLPNEMKINVLVLPDDDDPDSFARKHNTQEYINYIENNQLNWIDYLLQYAYQDSLNDINKASDITKNFISHLALIPDDIYRDLCTQSVAAKLNISHQLLTQQIDKQIQDNQKEQERIEYQQILNRQQQAAYSAQQTQQTQQPQQPPTPQNQEDNFDEYAMNILSLLLRYGNLNLFPDTPDQIRVSDYIINCLVNDNITFSNPLLQQIFEEYQIRHDEPDFDLTSEFCGHPNTQIGEICEKLLFDEHQLSRFFEIEDVVNNGDKISTEIVKKMPSDKDNLNELVPRVVYEYKYQILRGQRFRQLQQQMKEANDAQNYQLVLDLAKQLDQIEQITRQIAQFLNRVIL